MKDISLVLSSLKSRWLSSTLSVLLTAFGVMLALIVIQFGHHVQNRLSADGKNIDIVLGAKGSPLQLILSSVYHIDIPTGNIPYKSAKKWMKHPQVKAAIPLALGDNWKGYRIVGTTPAYMAHYNADLSQGRVWKKSFEAVAGAHTGLKIGDTFSGSHGIIGDGHAHDDMHYTVTGVLQPSGSVLDRLILTSLNSVLEIHGQESIKGSHKHNEHKHDSHKHDEHKHNKKEHDTHKHHDHHDHDHDHGHKEHKHHDSHDHKEHKDHHGHDHKNHQEHAQAPEITALLLTTKSPIANMNLPHMINRETRLQAANPALEITRLTSMLGLGSKSFSILSSILITIACLSIFAGLAGSLENRMGDLAVLRAIGYSKHRIFRIITMEGMIIVILGLALGISLGLGGFAAIAQIITPLQTSGANFTFTNDFILIISGVCLAGFVAATFPALKASKVDVAKQLSHNA